MWGRTPNSGVQELGVRPRFGIRSVVGHKANRPSPEFQQEILAPPDIQAPFAAL